MRLISYSVLLNDDGRASLVKEKSGNYPELNKDASNPMAVTDILNAVFNANKQAEEHAYMLALDAKAHCVGVFEVAHGGAAYCNITPKEVFVRACLCGAYSVIVAHNHPSGDVEPSGADIALTKRLVEASNVIGIPIYDHIIIGNTHYSFFENMKSLFHN